MHAVPVACGLSCASASAPTTSCPFGPLSCGLHRVERLIPFRRLTARRRRRGLPKDDGERSVIAGNVLDRQFSADALVMATWRRGKPDPLLPHSDEGSQYTSEKFQRLVTGNGVPCPISRSGNVWDNAAMESFFSSLKSEASRETYRTRDQARADVFDCIEGFYNPTRRHSILWYLSPMDFE